MRWLLTLGDFEDEVGIVLALEWDDARATVTELVRFRPPKERAVWGKGFTGGALHEEELWVCGFNAVYRVELASGRVDPVLVRDDFNDLHHLALEGDRIWVVNTGMDRVEAFDLGGERVDVWPLVPRGMGRPRDASDDLYFAGQSMELPLHQRRLMDQVHPNHIALHGGRLLVTRFSDGAVDDLGSGDRIIPETPGYPHDAHVVGEDLWLTCTRGSVVRYAPSTAGYRECQHLDVFDLSGQRGWCRGLHVGPTLLVVGLTRITRMPRVRWGPWPFESTRTGVVLVNRDGPRLEAWIDLGAFGHHPKLFSIISW